MATASGARCRYDRAKRGHRSAQPAHRSWRQRAERGVGMTAVVLIPGVLRAEAGGASRLTVDADGTLGAVLDELAERFPRLERRIRDERRQLRRYVNVYVDGDDCRAVAGLDTPVKSGAEIQV